MALKILREITFNHIFYIQLQVKLRVEGVLFKTNEYYIFS